MKTVKKIKLHNLSQAEMADKEMNLLKGGSGLPGYCVSVCLDAMCPCEDDGSGTFPTSANITNKYINSSPTEEGVSEWVKEFTKDDASGLKW